MGGLDSGHKGYGLSLTVEALTGGLAGFGRADPKQGWGATVFQLGYLPDLSGLQIYFAVAVTAVIALLLFSRWWRWALGTATVLAVVTGLMVNPLIHGLGALDDSDAARAVRNIDRRIAAPAGGRWAADSLESDALLNAQGVQSLSSYNDPVDPAGWRVLDPRGTHEGQWNRLANIVFDWRPGLRAPQITNPFADQISVAVDPCDARLDRLRLAVVVASHPVDAPCLSRLRTLRWSGTDFEVYRRSRASGAQQSG